MKMPRQHKKNTREEREIIQNAFMDCRNFFLDKYEAQVKIMEKYLYLFGLLNKVGKKFKIELLFMVII